MATEPLITHETLEPSFLLSNVVNSSVLLLRYWGDNYVPEEITRYKCLSTVMANSLLNKNNVLICVLLLLLLHMQ